MQSSTQGATPGERAIRVGLLSPYTGTNLGDQAIQVACIANLKARLPQLELCGIYLNAARTAAIHGIETFPITGLSVPFYSNPAELFDSTVPVPQAAVTAATQPMDNDDSSLRRFIKKIPAVRPAVLALRAIAGGIVNALREIRWLARTWRKVGELDLLVVAGGGQIDDEWGRAWGQPYVLLRWALIARWRRCPFAVVSVGVGYTNHWLSRRFFSHALGAADYLTCRDHGSAVAVAKLLGGKEPQVVFDIAGSLTDTYAMAGADDLAPGDAVAVSPIAFRRSGSWPVEAQSSYEGYTRRLSEFVAALLAAGQRIVIFTTSGSDRAAVADLMAIVKDAVPQAVDRVQIVYPKTLAELRQLLAGCNAVVASRLHGVILAHLAGNPVLAISFDRKVDVHMQQYEQEPFLVDIGTFSVADLQGRFENLLATSSEVRVALRAARERYGLDLQRQYDVLVNLARRPRR